MTPSAHRMRDPRQVEDLLLYRLSRLHGTAGTIAVRICEGEFGITRREWRLVAWLAEAGAMQPSALAERAALDRARTSRALSSLVSKGLVTRQVVASDRRLAVVALTERGQALYQAVMPRVAAINRDLLSAIDEADLQALDATLTLLQARASALVQATPQPKAQRRRGRRAADG